MALTISPVIAPASVPSATSGPLQLQPGTVVDARVLQILESGLARIAISGVMLDVASMAPLTPGANLRLAVSQSGNVTQLAILPPGENAPSAATANAPAANSGSAQVPSGPIAIGQGTARSQSAPASIETASVTTPQSSSPPSAKPVSPEVAAKIAVNDAVRAAAPRQDSLAPLFADVAAAASSRALPPVVATQVEKLLALRPQLDVNLSGENIKDAFKTSGLFLESSLKAAVSQPASASLPPAGDLKAALLVFRQVLSTWSETLPAASPAALASTGALSQPLAVQPSAQAIVQANAAGQPVSAPTIIPSAAASVAVNVPPQPQEITSVPAKVVPNINTVIVGQTVIDPSAVDPDMLPVLKAALQLPADNPAFRRAIATLPLIDAPALDDGVAPNALPLASDASQKSASPRDIPAPPLRGATPSPQQIASPTLAPLAGQAEVAHTLLHETDAALSRQVLHQVASLPTSVDTTNPVIANTGPRWSFEIPFATPHGTAMAQFEIAGEGGRDKDERRPEQKVWSARFSINVEPAGAIHARIAMANGSDGVPKTSVRLWAERPETAAQLQADSEQLSQALRQADLDPGSIVIGSGEPDQTSTRLSGHFLDRAL